MTRNGKIARLPGSVRAELNQRLENGEEGPSLLAWLNGLRDVKKTLKASFGGAPISKQNLSEWRQGGFREWQIRRELIEQARQLSDGRNEMEAVVDTSLLAGALAGALAARYAALLNSWDGEPDPKFEDKLRLLRGLNRDVALLQKTLHQTNQQEKAAVQESEERDKNEIEELRKKSLDVLCAPTEMEAIIATLGGGARAQWVARAIIAVKYDLAFPKDRPPRRDEGLDKEETGGEREFNVQCSKFKVVDPSPAGDEPVAPSPTESNPVAPDSPSSKASEATSEARINEDNRYEAQQSEDQNTE
jgi:hypothetical protein